MAGPKFLYKIRRKSDGLYSRGGIHPTFSKVGKVWKYLGHLKSHLNQFDQIPDDWEIDQFPVEQKAIATFSAKKLWRS